MEITRAPSSVSSPSPSNATEGITMVVDVLEEEEDVCRICRNPGYVNNPLSYPCACKGSIKFVHQDCLLKWFNHSRYPGKCEVCKHVFSFSPVYAENAPTTLPLQEFLAAMAMKACHFMLLVLRLIFIMSIWLLMIPLVTFWVWKLSFVRSFTEARGLFLGHFSTTVMLIDCMLGFLISAIIHIIFFVATSLMDLGGHDAERERDAQRAQHIINLDDDGRIDVEATLNMIDAMIDELNAIEAAEPVAFYDLVGMQGPVLPKVVRAFIVLAGSVAFLCVIMFFPFSIGRLTTSYSSVIFTNARGPLLPAVIPDTETACSLPHISMKNASTDVTNSVLFGQVNGIFDQVNICGLNEIPNQIRNPLSDDATKLPDFTILAIGYMIISSLAFLYVAVVSLIRYRKGELLTMGRYLANQFLATMKHSMSMIKIAFLSVLGLSVNPMIYGKYLDICTMVMFSMTVTQNAEVSLLTAWITAVMHRLVGATYIQLISIFFSVLGEILSKEVLYFLPDPDDINYNPLSHLDDPVHMHGRRILVSVVVSGSSIVMLVFFPVKLVMWIHPSFFPLDITSSDPLTILPAMLMISMALATLHFKLRSILKSVLCHWFVLVGWALGLADFLLPTPRDNGLDENVNRYLWRHDRLHVLQFGGEGQAMAAFSVADRNIHASESDNFEESCDADEQFDLNYIFVLRIILLLVVACMSMLIFMLFLIVLPISIGRKLLNTVPVLTHEIQCNDLFTFFFGSCAIWTALVGARYSVGEIRARGITILATQRWKWFNIVVKSSFLLSIWIFVIPLLIGLLYELLVILPILVPIDETPVFNLSRAWLYGLSFLHMWTYYVIKDIWMPFTDERWGRNFKRVRQDGFSRVRALWVLREIMMPIIMNLLTALSAPYVVARGVFTLFGCSLLVNSAVYRFAWVGCLWMSMLCFCAKKCYAWLTNFRNCMLNDRYRIGSMLQNFGDSR